MIIMKQAIYRAVLWCATGLAVLSTHEQAVAQAVVLEPISIMAVPRARRDSWGTPLPPGALARAGTARMRSMRGFRRALFSPDGTRVWAWAVTDESDELHIWEYPRGRELSMRAFAEMDRSDFKAFSPDGKSGAWVSLRALTAGDVILADVSTGQEIRRFPGHGDSNVTVAFSADGAHLLAADRNRTAPLVRIWDIRSGKELRRFSSKDPDVKWLFALPKGEAWLASKSNYDLEIWGAADGKRRAVIKTGEQSMPNRAFSPDGKILATYVPNLSFWDTSSGKLLGQVPEDIWSVAFSRDSRLVATAGIDRDIVIRSAPTGKEVHRIAWPYRRHSISSIGLDFAPNGDILLVSGTDMTVHFFHIPTGKEVSPLEGHRLRVSCVAFSPDGKTLASAGNDGAIRLWDSKTGMAVGVLVRTPPNNFDPGNAEHDPWRQLAYWDRNRIAANTWGDEFLRVYDTVNGRELHKVKAGLPISSIALSPDRRTLAVTDGESAALTDAASGKQLRRFPPIPAPRVDPKSRLKVEGDINEHIAFSLDGRVLAQGCGDGLVHVWDVATGRHLQQLGRFRTPVCGVAFAPDGRLVAACGGSVVERPLDPELQQRRTKVLLEFAPSGVGLSSADIQEIYRKHGVGGPYHVNVPTDIGIRVWEVATGKQVLELKGHEHTVFSVGFSPNGRLLASGSKDGTIRVWDVATGQALGKFTDGNVPVNSVVFSPDGAMLASAMENGLAYTWDMRTTKP